MASTLSMLQCEINEKNNNLNKVQNRYHSPRNGIPQIVFVVILPPLPSPGRGGFTFSVHPLTPSHRVPRTGGVQVADAASCGLSSCFLFLILEKFFLFWYNVHNAAIMPTSKKRGELNVKWLSIQGFPEKWNWSSCVSVYQATRFVSKNAVRNSEAV